MLQRFDAWLPWRKRRAPQFSKQEVLASLPVRNSLVEWELNEEQEVVLRIPRRKDRMGRFLSRIFAAPDHKQVVLDELGSDVWQLCTGTNSVDAIVRAVAQKYKLNRREVELSLSSYLRQLAQRGFIGLQIARPAAASAGVATTEPVGSKRKSSRKR